MDVDYFPRKACREWAMRQDTWLSGALCDLQQMAFCVIPCRGQQYAHQRVVSIRVKAIKGPCTLQRAPQVGGGGCYFPSPGRALQRKGQGAWVERKEPEGRESRGVQALPKLPSASPPTRPLPTCWHHPFQPDLMQLFSANPTTGLCLLCSHCLPKPFPHIPQSPAKCHLLHKDSSLVPGQMCPISPQLALS